MYTTIVTILLLCWSAVAFGRPSQTDLQNIELGANFRRAVRFDYVTEIAAVEMTPERKFWNAVLDRARSCVKAREYSPPALCFLKSTPEKCQSLVYDALLGSGEKQQWYLCVISCASAGWYSRTFGECSRALH